jgi:choline dehydrogenase-like flavoprotein
MSMPQGSYDAVIIGAGPVGINIAMKLTGCGKRVLLLEAGRASGLTYDGWLSYVDTYRAALIKEPNSPYPPNANAPSTYSQDVANVHNRVPVISGYQVERGPFSFGSTYLRSLGGTSLHWLGTCPRMVPNDFRMQTVYGVGVDWPITYEDLQRYYCEAEWELGVAGNKDEQERLGLGIKFPRGYDYPMEGIPQSYSDGEYAKGASKARVKLGGRWYGMKVARLPQARNSIPRPFDSASQQAIPGRFGEDARFAGRKEYRYRAAGAVGAPLVGQRCEGNASCIPICPVQAKYSALRTLNEMDKRFYTLVTQAVATRLLIQPNGRIGGVEFKRYASEGSGAAETAVATATLYVVAAHAVESAKLLLASGPSDSDEVTGAANSSDQVGRNLMDHPFFLTWALNPDPVGAFRGPGQTSEIPSFRDGAFRKEFAAFRIDLGNWGWDIATFPPQSNVNQLVATDVIGRELREELGRVIPRQLRVGYVIEQLPESRNRVTIDGNFKDPIGCFRPVIDYDLSDYTREAMVAALKVSNALFEKMKAEVHTEFTSDLDGYMLYTARSGETVPLAFYGSGHHMGTHRMGVSRTDSVTDSCCRSWDHENLYVVGCGSMPTVGCSNPTLTAVAIGLRAADDMLKRLR